MTALPFPTGTFDLVPAVTDAVNRSAFYAGLPGQTSLGNYDFGSGTHLLNAGIYSATTHYLKAVAAAGTDETQAVMEKMRSTPIDDFFAKGGKIREDGRMVHDMYLYEVKSPSESTRQWDYYKFVATIPTDQAFQPLSESKCPLVKKTQ